MPAGLRAKNVFINCPFDASYKPMFEAIVFTVYFIGFRARCALEVDDASEARLSKIVRIIEQCAYGIHDISSVGLGTATGLPRFNMPFELGLDLGCKLFGTPTQRRKGCLILDSEQYRYRTTISDLAGQDIHSHGANPDRAISEVRNWLATASKTKGLPGGAEIAGRYAQFIKDLPAICANLKRLPEDLTFTDFSETVEIWLKSAR